MNKILEEKILKAKIVSFDMFDTLVLRIIDNPEILFDMMGYIFDIKDFRNIRTSMQAKCGLELQQNRHYPHANIDEIYDYIKDNTNIKDTKKLMQYEIDKEIELLYPNNQMLEVYKFAKKHKKRVIVTSDMYLKMDTIEKILDKCGYKSLDKIYLSSEERAAKFDGTLYDLVIKEEKVLPEEILHIGDSLKDDVEMADSKGLITYHYKDTLIEKKSDDIALSIANGIIRLINQNETNFWVKTGSISGLMYLGLYNELLKKNPKEICFLARDGYNLYNLFNKYNSEIDSKYVYTSRRALLLAGIREIDEVAKGNLPPFTFGQTIKEILEYIGMDKIFDEEDLKKIGFKSFDDRIKTLEEMNRLKEIYSLKEEEVLSVCEKERKDAIKYFKSLNIFDGDNLFFDCGWNGSSQYLLENFIHSEKPSVNFEFYYNGIFENEKSKRQLKNRNYSTYLFDINKNQDIVSKIQDSIVLMELFFGAPENSVLKYENGTFKLDKYENDLDYKKDIYKGIEMFFEYALPLFKEYNYKIDPKLSIQPIIRLIEKPSMEEAKTIGDIENVDAFAKQTGVHKYIAKMNYEDIVNNNNIEVYWKYGLIKRDDIDSKVKKFVRNKFKMDSNNNYIFKYAITGINNPQLSVVGYCPEDTKLVITENSNEVEYIVEYNKLAGYYVARALLKNDKSIINIYLNNDDEKLLIKTIKNNKFNRMITKVFTIIRRILHIFLIIPRKIGKVIKVLARAIRFAWRKYHFLIPPKMWKEYTILLIDKIRGKEQTSEIYDPFNKKEYNMWLKENPDVSVYEDLEYKPLISFVIPVYNVSEKLLSECLDSIINQSYDKIEICLADDCSTKEETINTLKEYEKKDSRIKVVYRKKNGHISLASNSALELVTGEYVAMMDNDDVIPKHAIFEMVKAINNDRTIDMIYTDEDKLDIEGNRCDPHIKSDYAPDTLLSVNYFCHFTLLRTSILRKIGGWRVGVEGAQDWDLFLRFVEEANNIYHLPKILYHWRMIPGSTSMGLKNKDYAMDTAKVSIEEALKRRKTPGIVHLHDRVPYYWIEYTYPKEPMISIIIPTKDYASILDTCLKSVYEKTSYKNFEVIVANNRSEEEETYKIFDKYKKKYKNFSVVKADMEFNYSRINNIAVKKAKGDYILLLNNDTEVITGNWLQIMVGYAMQSHIGAVGVKLIYPDRTIQHGGVVMGMGGIAGHAFVNEPMHAEGIYGRLCVPYNYSVVTAACLMIEKKKYNEVNGLTEELKVAYNDVDLCLKLIDKGYYNIMLPMVELFHYESKSRGKEDTKEKQERFFKEIKYMEDHWQKYVDNDPMYNKNLSRNRVFMLDKKHK